MIGMAAISSTQKYKQKAKNVGIGIGIAVAIAVAIGFAGLKRPTAIATPIPIPMIGTDGEHDLRSAPCCLLNMSTRRSWAICPSANTS